MFKKSLLVVSVAAALSLAGCGGGSGSVASTTPPTTPTETRLSATAMMQDVQGILSEQPSASAQLQQFFHALIGTAYADEGETPFQSAWVNNIVALDNSDSLMGFLNENVSAVLAGFEGSDWYYEKEGSGTITIVMEGVSYTADYYSTPITVEGGKGSRIYFGFKTKPEMDGYNYKSDKPLLNTSSLNIPDTVLTLKETPTVKTFYWVEMGKYADQSNSEWNVNSDPQYVNYKRGGDDSDGAQSIVLPAINRSKNAAGDGRVVIFMVDKNKKEIYFEHLTASERHNRQEHYTIKLTGLDNTSGKLRISSDSEINYTRFARQYQSTTLPDGKTVNLVNDNSRKTIDRMQGKITSGMKYFHKEGDISSPTVCIKLPTNLSVTYSAGACTSSNLALLTPTSDFDTYKNAPATFSYLPSAGTTYNDIDLRVNLPSMFNASYSPDWISLLPTNN